jgi:hypothetical protein
VPSGNLNAYGGDPEDDAPTRLYAPSSAPPPPMKTMPRNERPMQPTVPALGAATMGAAATPRNPFAKPKGESKLMLYIGAAGAALVVLLGVYFLGGSASSLVITVSGPGGKPVSEVEVFVDDVKKCDASPCKVEDLAAGAHLVRATAKGYQEMAQQAVSVQKGEQATQNLSLVPAGAGTGLRVSALGSGLKLYVDGQEIGELPQSAKNLTAGEHVVRVGGNDRYEQYEERVTLDENETKTLGPLKLKVLKGLATFKAGPGADGARVLLDGRLVPELPSTIEVPAGKQLTLVATKDGYSNYRRTVSFDDGVAEKTFEITMVEGSDEPVASAAAAAPEPKGSSRSSRTKPSTPPPAPAPAKGAAKGKATLNLNSIPVSNVIVNGRPLGSTPKMGIQVAPGPQTVVFVHAKLGRKVMSATVNGGETKTFMA